MKRRTVLGAMGIAAFSPGAARGQADGVQVLGYWMPPSPLAGADEVTE